MTFGVLAPVAHEGELGTRAKDLTDGAQLAVDEINAKGGVLGKKLELQIVDDACDAQVAYEAAKAFLSDERRRRRRRRHVRRGRRARGPGDRLHRHPVPGHRPPPRTTSSTRTLQSTFLMNGTVYQQALSSVFWMNYRQAQRLAVVQDDSAESKALARKAIGLVDGAPKLVSLQTVEPGGQDMKTIAARPRSPPSRTSSSGPALPAKGGELAQGAARGRLQGHVQRDRRVREPRVPERRRVTAADGAYVTATATAEEHADGASRGARASSSATSASPGSRRSRATTPCARSRTRSRRRKTTDGPKVVKAMTTLDPDFVNSLGVVRFAHDHTLLYDNRVILEGEGRQASPGSGRCAPTRWGEQRPQRGRAASAVLAGALVAPALARADGDPASDVLIKERAFYPYEVKLPAEPPRS